MKVETDEGGDATVRQDSGSTKHKCLFFGRPTIKHKPESKFMCVCLGSEHKPAAKKCNQTNGFPSITSEADIDAGSADIGDERKIMQSALQSH